ncbi:MAG: hypothetical protein E7295_03890 [Lachnospiraceae bacterium]|jgi:hypothetical protein|nr:hypothetical protein [Lachnospiraceae bacterium]
MRRKMPCWRFYYVLLGVMILFCVTAVMSFYAEAAADSTEKNEKWRELRDYPMQYGDEELTTMSLEEQLELLNPPQDMLEEFSTEELAELMLRYPLSYEMLGWFDFEISSYFSILESQSSIFSELISREGGNTAILKVADSVILDVDIINTSGGVTHAFMESASVRTETFFRNFVVAYWNRFSQEERDLYRSIHGQRSDKYYVFIENEGSRKFFEEIPLNDSEPVDGFIAASELKKRWYEKKEYPITPKDPTWKLRSLDELYRILTPPDDILKSLTLNELTELVLCYPFLRGYEDYDSARQFFNLFFERRCKVFKELLDRENGLQSLLYAYEANDLNVSALNEEGLDTEDESVIRELFLCKFVDFYSALKFHDEEVALYEKIYRKKKAVYDRIEDDEIRMAFETRLSTQMEDDASENDLEEHASTDNFEQSLESSMADLQNQMPVRGGKTAYAKYVWGAVVLGILFVGCLCIGIFKAWKTKD